MTKSIYIILSAFLLCSRGFAIRALKPKHTDCKSARAGETAMNEQNITAPQQQKTMNMRTTTLKLLLALALISPPLYLKAQGDVIHIAPFDNEDNRNRGGADYQFSIMLSGTQLDGGIGAILGLRGGVVLNETFLLGIAFNTLLPTKTVACPMPYHHSRHHLSGIYGGFLVGKTRPLNDWLNLTGDMLIGLGGLTWNRPMDRQQVRDNDGRIIWGGTGFRHPWSSAFMVLEPRIATDFILRGGNSISLGISYRYCPFFRLEYKGTEIVSQTAFNGFSVGVGFTFNFQR